MSTRTERAATPKLVNQKDIAAEWGVPTRDILSAVQKSEFPRPVRVMGKKWWFRRSDVAKHFKDHPG